MRQKKFYLVMTLQICDFANNGEIMKALDVYSDDEKELINILNKYVNKFFNLNKPDDSWAYFHAEIVNQCVVTYDLERTVFECSLERKD